MDKAILPECFADTLLAETLVPTKIGYSHQASCFKVESAMKHGRLNDSFALGIVDNDKTTISYLKDFTLLAEQPDKLLLWKHPAKPHYIIQICPALERWVLDVCDQAGISTEDFGIKNDLEALKNITKRESSLQHEGLCKLFKAIRARQDHPSIRKLTNWIQLLRDHNYHVSEEALKQA